MASDISLMSFTTAAAVDLLTIREMIKTVALFVLKYDKISMD